MCVLPMGCPYGPGISCMLVVIPNSCLPLHLTQPQPYVHPHRTLFSIPRGGGSCRSALALQLKGESQKGQRFSDRSGDNRGYGRSWATGRP